MAIATVNPATGETLKRFKALTSEEIDTKLERAQNAFQSYRLTRFEQRRQWLQNAAMILERDAEKFATIMTTEMGKTKKSAISEVKKCALVCRYYADNGEAFLADEYTETDATKSYVSYQPLGIILAVMPWNFPFWQVFRFAAPTLMAGNVGVLKHASNVPQCALAIEAILEAAGFPEGVFQTLLIGASQVEQVIQDERVKAATLTGSEPAGASLASLAGKEIKPTVLELGGSDPLIVMPSADLDEAVDVGTLSRTLNNGQSCIASKRFILHEAIADQFLDKLHIKFASLKVGDPMDDDTDVGPLATESILNDIVQQVDQARDLGATILLGGKRLDRAGNFYLPTILTDIPTDAPTMKEEFFAPVAMIFTVKNIDEAIALANDIPFGLGSSAWTQDTDEQQRFIRDLGAGAVFINSLVKSNPRLPFGGIKRSGYGRELGLPGIRAFVNAKTVWIK
ncbi:NAD-dependent succinate-semialdehyde dehydrogenase [[Limnothrix rosea] IAM M-220]|uniref:NAD-dependent succinate-semialdehyde dehydrogenase n=1 Tax=[Limnothrix rosea] IAM M-220 TaxID=454133 RepID=UPI00095DD0C0|nr:NAD-dependent succinate-semialdehyde dehydrogenase [[Limnothrix rosea] IAM M-220]OKH12484.1 NADP-dependent succinic semialdehyde dehydrogenase [[Limnothrix rosea] IAM M-220]